MYLFDRIVLGFIGLVTATLYFIASSSTFDWTTHSPEAILISPESAMGVTNIPTGHQNLIKFLKRVAQGTTPKGHPK